MKSKHAHAENPPSHTHRLISNVRHRVDDDGIVRVRANFIVHRVRDRLIDPYVGRYDHELVRRRRRACASASAVPCCSPNRSDPARG